MIWSIGEILEKIGLTSNSIGYAFSGGGARGFSHIGVIKAFEEFGLRPNVMAGVSAGSVAAVMYGAGLSPDDIATCFKDFSKMRSFVSFKMPGNSLMKIDKFGKLIESWLPVRNLEDLQIPTIVCATDFQHCKSIGWAKGRSCRVYSLPVRFRLCSSLSESMAEYSSTEVCFAISRHGLSENTARLYMVSTVLLSAPCGKTRSNTASLRSLYALTG